jgi:hypothetical protein
MPALNLKPHAFKMVRGQPQLDRVDPYVRLSKRMDDNTTGIVYIQGGRYFSEEGETALKKTEVPEWVAAEVAKLSDQCKAEVGLS